MGNRALTVMKLPDEQTIDGDIKDAIIQYCEEKKPLGIFFMGIIGDGQSVKPEIMMSARIHFDWLAGQLEELVKLYREKAKDQDYCQ